MCSAEVNVREKHVATKIKLQKQNFTQVCFNTPSSLGHFDTYLSVNWNAHVLDHNLYLLF